jgi:hypothetical protein
LQNSKHEANTYSFIYIPNKSACSEVRLMITVKKVKQTGKAIPGTGSEGP